MSELVETDLADIDREFGNFIARFGDRETDLARAVAARLSRSVREGHICLDLSAEQIEGLNAASLSRRLQKSPAFGPPEGLTPIVIAGPRLFLRRYWDYEQALAKAIVRRAQKNPAAKGKQRNVIEGALANRFTIISGGPGTGKTTAVLRILTRFYQAPGGDRLRVALVAPTGKAAARLEELLRKVQGDPKVDPAVKERMPQSASTIHRLLGWKPDSVFFRHDRRNPLALDLLVVDEASMVPLPLMSKLFDALPERTRVILLGDRDQLASVEPGAVLADMAEAASVPGSSLSNSLFVLTTNYRFGNENAIYRLSQAIRAGETDNASRILLEKSNELAGDSLPAVAQVPARLASTVVDHYRSYITLSDPAQALAQLSRFRVLCALRRGPYGVEQINRVIESALRDRGVISEGPGIYRGMPLLVTVNDYQAKLFNGDIGVILPDPAETDGQLWAWFIGPDNTPRRISPARLPDYDLAYAMTVHKAQGSEFATVLLILPDRDVPVLSRELVYTGLTRASQRVEIWSDPEVLRAAIGRTASRVSGLQDALLAEKA